MTITYHNDLEQGSDAWLAARCGLLTASEMSNIITPAKLQFSESKGMRTHLHELVAQRITKYVEPHYIGDHMLRGMVDEVHAREKYSATYAPVETVGFVTNDKWGFTIGYSPDGIVGEDGQIECKSRLQKYQLEAILNDEMDSDFMLQVQTGLLVTERKWCDFISYCGGLPMFTKRIFPDAVVQDAIVAAARIFHGKIEQAIKVWNVRLSEPSMRLIATERVIEREMEITE